MCGIHFQRQGNIVVSVGNWKEHSGKLLCNKALATLQRLYNPNRLLYPMKRTNPKGSADPGFVRISWQEALATIAANMKKIRDQYGAEKLFIFCGDPKEPRPAAMRLARYFGTYHYGTESSVACRKGSLLAEQLVFGNFGAACVNHDDLDAALFGGIDHVPPAVRFGPCTVGSHHHVGFCLRTAAAAGVFTAENELFG